MSNKIKQVLLFSLIFGVPILLFFLLRSGQDQVLMLKKFHPRVNDSGDTIYHKISDFMLIDQKGNEFNSVELDGKIYVANFFFTRCPGICPKMMNNLKTYQRAITEMGDVKMISITIDPKNDSVEVLNNYAEKYQIEYPRWKLLTGDKDNIYKQAKENFIISVAEGEGNAVEDFTHSERVMLIDKEGVIRGYYMSTDAQEIDRLIIETRLLLKSYRLRNKNL